MNPHLSIFEGAVQQEDGIWGVVDNYGDQALEKSLREEVAEKDYEDYLEVISKHHSISVMDNEVKKFISEIPHGGIILDIGGCWGWHWRFLADHRPDLTIFIVDLIRQNLVHAKSVLKELVESERCFLVHGNAISLKFKDESFDGIWSVQTTQHIPNYELAIREIFRVLKPGGIFSDHNLNTAKGTKAIYKLMGRNYHEDGIIGGKFLLRRVNQDTLKSVELIFNNKALVTYSEVLFSPELKLPLGGRFKSLLGRIDAKLTGSGTLQRLFARQCGICIKKSND